MSHIAVILTTLLSIVLVQQALTAVCATALGVPVDRVRIFLGPALWSTTIRGRTVELGAIPTGGYVAFPLMSADPDAEDALSAAPAAVRLLVGLTPWVVLMLPVALVLGPTAALTSLTLTWPQYLSGGLMFWSRGAQYLGEAQRLLPELSASAVAATTVAKLVGVNLLPAPGTSGGIFVSTLLPQSVALGVQGLFAALVGLCAMGWLVALVALALF